MSDPSEPHSPIDPLTGGGLISLAEAAQKSGIDHSFLRRLAERGRLKAKKIGRNWVTTLSAIEEYKKSRGQGKRTDLDK